MRVVAPFKTRYLALIFVALSLFVPLLGSLYVKVQIPQLERETLNILDDAIVRLNTEQIEVWLQ